MSSRPPSPDPRPGLLRLPPEIVCMLTNFIDDIRTFTNVSSSNKYLYNSLKLTHPQTILRLAAGSGPALFQPHPTFLVTITARSASAWALTQPNRDEILCKAFSGDIDTLYEFCLTHGTLTLAQIRKTYKQRFSIINRLSASVQQLGWKWELHPGYFENTDYKPARRKKRYDAMKPQTLWIETALPVFQIIIYGELFAQSMDAFLADPEGKSLPRFSKNTRMEYLRTLPSSRGGWYYDFVHLLEWVAVKPGWEMKWTRAIRHYLDPECVQDTCIPGNASLGSHQHAPRDPAKARLLMSALEMQGLDGMGFILYKRPERLSGQYLDGALRINEQVSRLSPSTCEAFEVPDVRRELASVWKEFHA
ncbi:hypothetical protein ASPVEDRAFT_25145 [Aspergillus versicolor CBS 583.65]|uniref:Uncharacterized protein n=1 Tax=Aspergillus versicolor CBS 583.65 TaxID=1036611 RepID=A0A1L9P9S4_ASPVE|nr:uncharacterized protein ASPVEDRAFT_25145 [Aspergillus versicolor CBS 583.65]OJI98248.1 hypothetical protein ASPVEDRAFT_25145 [Aspergillus versicolor CBS 583.65]